MIYDVTSLKARHFVYNDITDGSIYRLSVCSPLDGPCNGFTNSGACWSLNGNEINIGEFTENIVSESGKVSLVMHGESCFHNGPVSITTIKFVCDYSNSQKFYLSKKVIFL